MKNRATKIVVAGVASGGMLIATAVGAAADGGRKGDDRDRGGHGWQGGMFGGDVGFEQLDADGNGEISKEEFDVRHAAWLAMVDANGDGMLQQEELEAYILERIKAMAAEQSGRMIERLDSDSDGMVSADELGSKMGGSARRGDRMFNRLDADDSGGISAEELEAAKAMGKKSRGWDGKRRHGGKRE